MRRVNVTLTLAVKHSHTERILVPGLRSHQAASVVIRRLGMFPFASKLRLTVILASGSTKNSVSYPVIFTLP